MHPGRQNGRGSKIIGIDLNPDRKALGKKFGMTDFVNPKDVDNVVDHIVQMTGGWITVLNVSATSTLCARPWNAVTRAGENHYIIGVAGAGQRNFHASFPTGHWSFMARCCLWRSQGRTDVPMIVDWYMENRINIDDMITHTMPLEDINKAFDLMHAGESIRSVVVY